MIEAYEPTLDATLAFLGVPAEERTAPALGMSCQADATSDEWAERYRRGEVRAPAMSSPPRVARTDYPGTPELMTDRPNILYVHSHDTGRYVQPYGYSIPTPTSSASRTRARRPTSRVRNGRPL
jgi:hypothetical protein